MKFNAKVTKTFDTGSIKAICDVTIDDAIAIHGVKLIEGQNGRFVSMPSDKWKNAQGEVKHTDIVHPVNADTRAELFKAVTNAYDTHMQGHLEDDLPFGIN